MTPDNHAIDADLQFAVEKLSASGHKLTAPRLAVLQAAHTFRGAFSAAQLDTQLQQHGHPLGDASLFRTLKLYTDIGIMQRIHGFSECHRYILSPHAHAHRIVCTECGAVTAFDECGLDQLIATLEQQTGFAVEEHLLELFGRCAECRHQST